MNLNISQRLSFHLNLIGKNHKYTPDFKVGNEFWEIKGNQFLNEDGTWKNPYSKNNDGLPEAKHQLCIEKGIKILYKVEIKPYKDYFLKKYGKGFLQSLRKW